MAVKIRLKRLGKIRTPHYRIVVADSRTKRDGRAIEEIGRYVPGQEPSIIEVDSARAQYWLSVGAQPTEQVAALLKLTGDFQASKGDKNAKNVVKVAEPKPAFVSDATKKTVLRPKAEIKVEAPKADEAPAAEVVEESVADAAVEAPAEEVAVEAAESPAAEAEVEAPAAAEEAPAEEAPAAEEA
ncbi:MAG: 30S ribosomal protein S16 [Micrococcales bacterium]